MAGVAGPLDSAVFASLLSAGFDSVEASDDPSELFGA